MKNIKDLSIVELQALAYQGIIQIQQLQTKLVEIEREIASREEKKAE